MPDLQKFEKFNRRIAMGIEWIGLLALVFMMLITTIDVLGTKLFLLPVFGSLDMMMLAQLLAMSFAASATLIVGLHVKVEFFVPLLPQRVQTVVECLMHLLAFVLFLVIAWRLLVYSYDLQVEGEVTSTASIPYYPFAYGAAIACVPVCLVYLCNFMKSLGKVFSR